MTWSFKCVGPLVGNVEGLETYVARILGRRHFICEVIRVPLGVMLPERALVIHRVLQAVPVFFMGGVVARVSVPRAPVLVQVLESGQVTFCNCVSARVLVPRAPVLVQVLESGQVSIKGCVMARLLTPIKFVLSLPLQQSYTPPASRVFTYVSSQFHQEVQRLSRRAETELRRCPAGL